MWFLGQANSSWIPISSNIQQMEIWLVILFLSRKTFNAKQICVFSHTMKLGPGLIRLASNRDSVPLLSSLSLPEIYKTNNNINWTTHWLLTMWPPLCYLPPGAPLGCLWRQYDKDSQRSRRPQGWLEPAGSMITKGWSEQRYITSVSTSFDKLRLVFVTANRVGLL